MDEEVKVSAIREAFQGLKDRGHDLRFPLPGGQTLIFDGVPTVRRYRRGDVCGVACTIRILDADGIERRIDGHRNFDNPPVFSKDDEVTSNPVQAIIESVVDSVAVAPNSRGWRRPGNTVTTIFASDDGFIQSSSAVYATARAGAGLAYSSAFSNGIFVGQLLSGGTYFCQQALAKFDTSGIADTQQVTQADLMMNGQQDLSTTDFTMNARQCADPTTFTTADWVDGTGAMPALLASLSSASYSSTYMTFTENGTALRNHANMKTGVIGIVFISSRQESGTAPTGEERVAFDAIETSGTSSDPKLVVTHQDATVAEIDPVLRKVTAVVNVSTVNASVAPLLRRVLATINVSHSQAIEIDPVLRRVLTNINASHRQQATANPVLSKVTASINLERREPVSVSPVLRKVTASIGVESTELSEALIAPVLRKVTSDINVEYQEVIAASVAPVLRKVLAALNTQQEQRLSLAPKLSPVASNLNLAILALITLDTDLAKVTANLNTSSVSLLIGPVLSKVLADLHMSTIGLAITPVLRKTTVSLATQQSQLTTLGVLLSRTLVTINASQRDLLEIDPVLRRVLTSINTQQEQRLTVTSTLRKVTTSIDAYMIPDAAISPVLRRVTTSITLFSLLTQLGISPVLAKTLVSTGAQQRYLMTITVVLARVEAFLFPALVIIGFEGPATAHTVVNPPTGRVRQTVMPQGSARFHND